MAVKLRLKRMGSTHKPFYRVVAADSRSARDGRFLETLGTYDPKKDANAYTIKEDRVLYWLSVGATPTETVRTVLSRAGVMAKFAESKVKKATKAEKPAKKEATKTTAKSTAKKTTTKKATKKEEK